MVQENTVRDLNFNKTLTSVIVHVEYAGSDTLIYDEDIQWLV